LGPGPGSWPPHSWLLRRGLTAGIEVWRGPSDNGAGGRDRAPNPPGSYLWSLSICCCPIGRSRVAATTRSSLVRVLCLIARESGGHIEIRTFRSQGAFSKNPSDSPRINSLKARPSRRSTLSPTARCFTRRRIQRANGNVDPMLRRAVQARCAH